MNNKTLAIIMFISLLFIGGLVYAQQPVNNVNDPNNVNTVQQLIAVINKGLAASTRGSSPSSSQLVAGQYGAPQGPLALNQTLPFQVDRYGNLKVNVAATAPSTPIVTTPILAGVLTDRSGTVTLGGTSQVLAAANPGRKYLTIENPTTATEALYINFTSAASTGGSSSISLAPGGSFTMTAATYISQEAVTVTAATTAHAFTAKEQ